MSDGYLLSEEALKAIRRVVREYISSPINQRQKSSPWEDTIVTPETLIALSPEGGIPAVSREGTTGTSAADLGDDIPGEASCAIYRMVKQEGSDRKKLKSAGFSKTVYNLSDAAVPDNLWIVIVKDKFGDWYVTNTGLEFGTC